MKTMDYIGKRVKLAERRSYYSAGPDHPMVGTVYETTGQIIDFIESVNGSILFTVLWDNGCSCHYPFRHLIISEARVAENNPGINNPNIAFRYAKRTRRYRK